MSAFQYRKGEYDPATDPYYTPPPDPPTHTPVTFPPETTTESLVALRMRLLGGISAVAAHIEAGTFFDAPEDTKGGVPPSEFGSVIMWFLRGATLELKRRGYVPPELRSPRA